MLHTRLKEAGCRLLFNTTVKKIEESSVTVVIEGREESLSPVDQVILAVGLKPLNELKEILQKQKIRHFIIGDAIEPRRIIEATEEGLVPPGISKKLEKPFRHINSFIIEQRPLMNLWLQSIRITPLLPS